MATQTPTLATTENHLPWTGERMVPAHCDDRTYWEHVYRYRFARRFAKGRRVLDVACGEGYGAYALSLGAVGTVGVDVSPEACNYARSRFGIDVICADASKVPVQDGSFDLITSFETIEHVADPARFVQEIKRLLSAGGMAVISTPNRNIYSKTSKHNDFHVSEMDRSEFTALLRTHFRSIELFGQCFEAAPMWTPAALIAKRSRWRNVPGYWRLRERAMTNARGGLGKDNHVRSDDEAVRFICESDTLAERLMGPYSVRQVHGALADQATYLIAVCREIR